VRKYYTFSRLGTHGALGNQLWQIAGTLGIAAKNNGIAEFPDWEYRPFFSLPHNYFEKIPAAAEVVDLYPDYLQDLSHFERISDYIRIAFYPYSTARELMEPYLKDLVQPATAVHVRRANNLTLPDHHPVQPVEYFEAALDELPRDNLWVFSDDLEWCRRQSVFKGARFGLGVPPGVNIFELTGAKPLTTVNAALDLLLMTQCQYHVISNSSFSWWGAWLADGQKVIYPSRWYGPALEHIDTSVMFPKDWIEMEIEPSWI
jgi:hypothetical protein